MSLSPYFIERDGVPVPAQDVLEWDAYLRSMPRFLAEDALPSAWVATIFMGMDPDPTYAFRDYDNETPPPPRVYETTAFAAGDGPWRVLARREACTREEALANHAEMVRCAECSELHRR